MPCSPGMRACAVTCGHKQWVTDYREELERQQIVAENKSLGYKTEYAEWIADHPLPTLKEWMKHREKAPEMTQPARPEAKHPDPQQFREGDKVWSFEDLRIYKVVSVDVEHHILGVEAGRDKKSLYMRDVERRTWREEDRPVEVARVREMADRDRKDEQAIENAEMKRAIATENDPEYREPTVQEIRTYNETGLLGAAMVSDEALPALRTVRNEFSEPFHENVGRAILDQYAAGSPRDSASVTEVLHERGQLPPEYDPYISMRAVDRSEYGLGAWERGAAPEDANALAQKIREARRCDYLEDVGTRLQENSRATLEAGVDPSFVLAQSATEMVNVPPRIDLDLREIKQSPSLAAVDTTRQPRVIQVPSEASTPKLGIPARPATMNLRAVASA